MVTTPNHINPVHTLTPHFFKINFGIDLAYGDYVTPLIHHATRQSHTELWKEDLRE